MFYRDYFIKVDVLPPADGGGFVATVPDLPGCMSDGDTPEEAEANARDAIDCWIETAERLGRPVPAPAQRSERRA